MSKSTSSAEYRMSGRGSKVSSLSPASRGNQKYMCSSLSVKWRRPEAPLTMRMLPSVSASALANAASSPRPSDPSLTLPSMHRIPEAFPMWCSPSLSASSGSSSTLPIVPSASFIAQKRRNAMALRATSRECELLVKAIRQLTQSVNVATSVSVMCSKCSRTIFSMVSKERRTICCASSCAAVVNTMNMLFQPDFTLATRARTIWLTQRMMSSRISRLLLCRMTTTKGRRKSFWKV
mmetsp:Transcript_35654/g.84492  ORF Transcript_35654/g.84492 Transcript_35654/m.84492 type:complete len:236 (-) Transcript_35654:4104-4811(-)